MSAARELLSRLIGRAGFSDREKGDVLALLDEAYPEQAETVPPVPAPPAVPPAPFYPPGGGTSQ